MSASKLAEITAARRVAEWQNDALNC